MLNWSSIDDVCDEFMIDKSQRDINFVRNELNRKRNDLHPDKTGGTFKTEEQKRIYLRVSEAIDFIDEKLATQSALIPISQLPEILPEIIEALTKSISAQSLANLANQVLQTESSVKEIQRRNLTRKLLFPRISSAVIGSICVLLFTFWDKIKGNPVLEPLSETPEIRGAWLIIFLLSCVLFVFTWWYEQLTLTYIEYYKSDEGLVFIFDELRKLLLIRGLSQPIETPAKEFSKIDLQMILQNRHREETRKLIKFYLQTYKKSLKFYDMLNSNERKKASEIYRLRILEKNHAYKEYKIKGSKKGSAEECYYKEAKERYAHREKEYSQSIRLSGDKRIENRKLEFQKFKNDPRNKMRSMILEYPFLDRLTRSLTSYKNLSNKDAVDTTNFILAKFIEKRIVEKIQRVDINEWYRIVVL